MSDDTLAQYSAQHLAACDTICQQLRAQIDAALSLAASKIWHGSPVWFMQGNPVVGYNVTSKNHVNLLFWSGQLFDEPALKAMGKFQAAQVQFKAPMDIDIPLLQRWLQKAATIVWDYQGMQKSQRARSKVLSPKSTRSMSHDISSLH
jgi:uncharacterized protein YdhG (YjbR/CyaY superfamily)